MKKDTFDQISAASSRGGVANLNQKRGEVVLTRDEQEELTECESTIQHGILTFREVGEALLKIRDHRLYRATHKTFEDYCRERWEFSKTHANRLIAAKATSDLLVEAGAKAETLTESVIRPLVGLSPARVKKVWARAQKRSNDKPPTARMIAQLATPRAASAKGSSASASSAAKVEVKAVVDIIRASFKANPDWAPEIEKVLVAAVKKL